MFKSFLKISFRNIIKNKSSAYLNIIGMTLGMAICLFIFNYIQFEMSYDSDKNQDDIYRVEWQHPATDWRVRF